MAFKKTKIWIKDLNIRNKRINVLKEVEENMILTLVCIMFPRAHIKEGTDTICNMKLKSSL